MKNTLSCFAVVLGVALGLTSCTYYENDPAPVDVPDSVSFSANVIPIFNARCNNAGCHSTGGIQPDLTPANAYNDLIVFGYVDTDFPDQSVLYLKVHSGSMVQFSEPGDAELILKWIQQGAIDN
jgi:hypothetical protein